MKLTISILFAMVSWFVIMGIFFFGISFLWDTQYSNVVNSGPAFLFGVIGGICYIIACSVELYEYLEKRYV